ncbi:MAG: type II secretion system protein N [Thiobacillus sp.]|uniref:type II secretion system protein N n=1 Tax=Thiobacillus sp. TaxID=924 RepID=UPI002893CA9A|nr:type II secretion system protein N [Thiobacillus sp.]MDT3705533.1 type II secretion system protein N [Thiobacillus sp.]
MPRKPVFDSLRQAPWSGLPLLSLFLLVALAALLAHWTWRFAAPRPPSPTVDVSADVKLGEALDALRAVQLFGAREGGAHAATERATALNLKLRGVFAALGGLPALAIVNVDGQDQAVATGQEIQPGVVLDAVAPDHVILLNRGARERLELDEMGRPLALAGGDIPLTRQEISLALSNPQSLGVQVRSGDGPLAGLVLTQVSGDGLVARLGLQSGDILRMVNGSPVASVQDLAQQLAGNANMQRVTVVGERQGKPLNLSYSLQQER